MSLATVVAKPRVRPPGLVYSLNESPPGGRLALMALQFGVMDALYLILVAIILRSAELHPAESVDLMGIACVALAVGTVLQALPRGPIGSGFLAPPVYSATYLAPSVLAAQMGGMPLVFGMTILAGLMEVTVALLLARLRVIITPVLSGLTVFVVGLQLGVVGVGQMLDVRHEALPSFHQHLLVTILTLAVCVGLSIWGRGTLKLLCSMLGLLAGMAAASFVGLIPLNEFAVIGDAGWLAVPKPALFHYGFSLQLTPAFLAAGIAAALRAVGVVTTCQRINDAAWQQPEMGNIRKGVLADGLANVFGGVIGAPGMSISPSLVGISNATGATSRVIAFAASAVLLLFGLSPKLAGLFLLIPPEVAGSLLVFTSSFMITGGMEIMLFRPADTRAVYVIGISTLLALSENVFPAYFRDLSPAARSIAGNPLAFGLAAAILLTLLFRAGARQRGETRWTGSAESREAALAFLRGKAQGWKVPGGVIEKAVAQTGEVLAFFERMRPGDADGALRAWFNGLGLGVTITCGSDRIPELAHARDTQPNPQRELDNEEAAVMIGLRDFLNGLTADRKSAKLRGERVKVTLSFVI